MRLAEAVLRENELGEEQRKEILDHVEFLARQAALPQESRERALGKTVLVGLGKLLAMSASLAKLWETLRPIIAGILGG